MHYAVNMMHVCPNVHTFFLSEDSQDPWGLAKTCTDHHLIHLAETLTAEKTGLPVTSYPHQNPRRASTTGLTYHIKTFPQGWSGSMEAR